MVSDAFACATPSEGRRLDRGACRRQIVAEISSAFCCASLGIVPTVRHADYIGSWVDVLREDNRAIVRAASRASKAADYILGFLPEDDSHAPAAPAAAVDRRAA